MPGDLDPNSVSLPAPDGAASAGAGLPSLPAWGAETREARLVRLLAKAKGLPPVPGVYLMKDAKGVVIYVGKANRLPDRVSSYFTPWADLGPAKQPMLDAVHDFDTLECAGEWEALLTENRLIKDIHPRFNARLTDDKTYPYLAVTQKEDFPRVYITRDLSAPELTGARVFGPFTAPGALREAIQLLQRIFKFRTCHLDIVDGDPKNLYFRPCLLYNIGQCTAPCAQKISRDAYRADVDRFIRFLESKRSTMLREMRGEMQKAAEGLEYEKAAALRDQIKAIEKLDQRAKRGDNWQPEAESFYADPAQGLRSLQKALGLEAPIRCIEAIDIAHLQGGETVGSKVCFVDGRPLKNEYRRYQVRSASNDDYTAIREVVSRRYREAVAGHELYPDVILIDGGLGQLHAALEAFKTMAEGVDGGPAAAGGGGGDGEGGGGGKGVKPPMVISLAKKEELVFVQDRAEPIRLSRNHAGLRLLQSIRDEAHRFAQHYHHVLRRKKTVGE